MIRKALIGFLFLAQAARAEPILSIAGTMDASQNYDVVLDALRAADADATSLTLFWDLLERDGRYAPEPDWPTIANAIYPGEGLQISLMISVIDTVADRRPSDLQTLAFSDPAVIERFDRFLTQVLRSIPDITLTSIGIGNEVDGFLTGTGWNDYVTFFQAAKAVAHRERPGVPVGSTITWNGLRQSDAAQSLANAGDVWMINHYPLTPDFRIEDTDKITSDLAAMIDMAGDKPVYLMETGYPSGGCNGTDIGQLQFTRNLLDFADDNAKQMPLVTLVWLHDLSDAEVAQYSDYYRVDNPCFANYLGTLGLRTRDGRDKPVFDWLRQR